jgi:secreted protein with Ig-like and vWFA domain
MEPDPKDRAARDRRTVDDVSVRDALGAFNAEEILDDPDELEPQPEHQPAATPDSPNPI